ncbi:hypothetical protein [Paraburkholderia tuberum]|uniref:hypothetical protein n=1 Tax=Paraburkholderia TaxID=1822464 RepID=UPI0014289DE2|nr:hypothetical protein [Paraburkholderia tuberum]
MTIIGAPQCRQMKVGRKAGAVSSGCLALQHENRVGFFSGTTTVGAEPYYRASGFVQWPGPDGRPVLLRLRRSIAANFRSRPTAAARVEGA